MTTIVVKLIWFDINDNDGSIKTHFEDCVILFYHDELMCVDFVESMPKSEKIFLIAPISNGIKLLSTIHDLRQIDSVFLFSAEGECEKYENLLDKYSKLSGIFDKYTDLFQSVRENIELCIQQAESFNFYEQHQKSTRDLSKEAGSFLWLRLFKDVILHLPHDEQAKKEMFEKLKLYYRNNNKQLKWIDKFDEQYKSEDAIRWYTREPCLYKQLNRALRTEDIELLYTYRYFIADLSKQLSQEYEILRESFDSKIKFYRGVLMFDEEIQKLKQNVGKLISTNGFLSTSLSKDVALKYTDQSKIQQQNVLFEIEYDFQKIDSIIVASIAHFSQHPNEEEVLFDLDASFKLSCVTRDDLLNVTTVKMEVTDEGSVIAQEHINDIRKDMSSSSPVLVFGRLLTIIGQHDKSQRYFDRLLENPNGQNEEFIYYYMGLVQYHKGNYEHALQYYEHAYRMMSNDIKSREFASSYVLNDIGAVFHIQGKYDEALDYFRRALEIREKYQNYTAIATSLANIAMIYRIKGEYDLALECSMKSLHMRETYLPSEHQETAKILNNIAGILTDKDELGTALEYHRKSLKMLEKSVPAQHDDIASCLSRTALVLTHQGKYDEALDYYMRALKIREQILPKEHLRMATTLSDIGYVYYSTKNYIQALEYFEKSLQIRETHFSDINDIGRVNVFTYIGLAFIKLHKYRDALTYFKHALQVGKIVYPIGHVKLTDCFINMGIAFREMCYYDKAFKYFESASKNEEQNSEKPNQISLARTYDSMGMCLCDQGDDKQGLVYRMKAVQIIKKVFPRPQYADCIDPIGHAFFTNEKYDCALECFLASLTIRLQCLPPDHLDLAQSFLLIGDVFVELEKNIERESFEQYNIKARFYYEQALAIYQEKQHSNTAYILNSIGSIYENIHKYHRVLEYYYQVLAWYQKCPPSDDSDREKCERSIARVKWFIL